jgi:hypothetical protein
MAAAFDSTVDRRAFLCALGVGLCTPWPAQADVRAIGELIAQTQGYQAISRRIEVISHALVGRRYQAYTLIGGPRRPEEFVMRDDRFDCVTFCETVLAAARARDLPSFEIELRTIRYHNGSVAWRDRNHDFAAWCERNTANGTCRPVALGATVEVAKTIEVPRALGRRHYTIAATSSADLLTHRDSMQDGDIVGFVSRRKSLDYFHTGFAMRGRKGEVLLRHASESHGRVVDERMASFLAVNRPRYVTVLRPQERT